MRVVASVSIVSVEKVVETNFYITTDEKSFPTYRRSESGNWENMIGESWEQCYDDWLEDLFKEYQATHQPTNTSDDNPETCPHCGGKQYHHSIECYTGA